MAILSNEETARILDLRPEEVETTADGVWSVEKAGCAVEARYAAAVLGQLKRIYESWFGAAEIDSGKLVFVNKKADDPFPSAFVRQGIVNLFMNSTFNDGCNLVYQAAHEVMHVVLRRRTGYTFAQAYRWFEETVCELASLAALVHPVWTRFSPPGYPYTNTLKAKQYADDCYAKVPKVKPDFTAGIYRLLEDRLKQDPCMREVNALFAMEMAKRVEIDAAFWASVLDLVAIVNGQAMPIEQAFRLWYTTASGRKKAIAAKVIGIFDPQSALPQQSRAY